MQVAPVWVAQGSNWTDVANVAVTVALAFFAFVEMRRSKKAEKREEAAKDIHRAAVEVRISAEAYALRRQIASWTKRWPHVAPERPIDPTWEQNLVVHFDAAERRMTSMVAQSAEASQRVSGAIIEAYVKFYRATEYVNRIAAHEITARHEAREAAFYSFHLCVDRLNEVIRDEIQQAEAADEGAHEGPR